MSRQEIYRYFLLFSLFFAFFIKVHYTSSKKVKEKNIFYPIAK